MELTKVGREEDKMIMAEQMACCRCQYQALLLLYCLLILVTSDATASKSPLADRSDMDRATVETLAQLIIPKDVSPPGNKLEISLPRTEASEQTGQPITGTWAGTWIKADDAVSKPFTLYINATGTNMIRAVGSAEGWSAWEVFSGHQSNGQWKLDGVKVIRNQRPESSYVLDTLLLEETEAGGMLEGVWEDKDADRGFLFLNRKSPLAPDCPFLAELQVNNNGWISQTCSPLSHAQLMLRRLGPVEFGMTLHEAEQALGEPLIGDKQASGNPNCYEAAPASGPDGLWFMIENDHIVRVDIRNPLITTKSGAKVGISEESVFRIYKTRIKSQQHQYFDNGKYLVYVPTDEIDKDYRMIFDVVDGIVVQIRAGKLPSVEYIEGCL